MIQAMTSLVRCLGITIRATTAVPHSLGHPTLAWVVRCSGDIGLFGENVRYKFSGRKASRSHGGRKASMLASASLWEGLSSVMNEDLTQIEPLASKLPVDARAETRSGG